MPKELRGYKDAMLSKFESLDHELPDDIKTSFISNSKQKIQELHQAYDSHLSLPVKMRIHVELIKEITRLECSFKRHYLSVATPRSSLEDDLSKLVKAAIQASHPISDADVANFLNPRISGYVAFVLVSIRKEFFHIEAIYNELLLIIMSDIAAHIRIECGYDIYAAISQHIRAGLQYSKASIDVETDITTVTREMQAYTPVGYRMLEPSNEQEVVYQDPCSCLQYVFNLVIRVATDKYNPATTREVFPGVFRQAEAYALRRAQATRSDGFIPCAIVAENYALTKSLHDVTKGLIAVQLPLFLRSVLAEMSIQWIYPLLNEYKNCIVTYTLTEQIMQTLNEQLKPVMALPTSLQAHQVTEHRASAPPRSPSP